MFYGILLTYGDAYEKHEPFQLQRLAASQKLVNMDEASMFIMPKQQMVMKWFY